MSKDHGRQQRLLHQNGLCVRCKLPARQYSDGSFYWHCLACATVHATYQAKSAARRKAETK